MQEKFIMTALDSFKCLADKCNNTPCCSNFFIDLAPATLKKWQRLAGRDNSKSWLLAGVIDEKITGEKHVRLATLAGSSVCVFLTPEGFCRIHSELGAEYLDEICRAYPLRKITMPRRTISCAMLSCPEIARLVMFGTTSPVFRHIPGKGKSFESAGKASAEQVPIYLYKLLRDLFSLADYPLNFRLTYLARVLAEIISLSQKGQLGQKTLAMLSETSKTNLRNMAAAIQNGQFAINPVTGSQMWDFLRAGAERFELFQACGLTDDMPIMQLAQKAKSSLEAKTVFYHELMLVRDNSRNQLQPFEKAFTRYLECRFMMVGFPFFQNAHPMSTFLTAVYPFSIVQMLLWLKASIAPKITENDIVDIVSKVEIKLGHTADTSDILQKNPELLNIERYLDWLLTVC